MNVGELRKAIEGVEDTVPVVYAWTWGKVDSVSLGKYLDWSTAQTCLIIGHTLGSATEDAESCGNIILHED